MVLESGGTIYVLKKPWRLTDNMYAFFLTIILAFSNTKKAASPVEDFPIILKPPNY